MNALDKRQHHIAGDRRATNNKYLKIPECFPTVFVRGRIPIVQKLINKPHLY